MIEDTHNRKDHLQWRVLYTQHNHEVKLSQRLERAGYEVYCPCIEVTSKWSDRNKKLIKPLFTRFFFIKVDKKTSLLPLQLGKSRYLYWMGKPAVVREEEIEVIKKWLNTFDQDQIESLEFSEGQEVSIGSGNLMGTRGIIAKVIGNKLYIYIGEYRYSIQIDKRKTVVKPLV